METLQIKSDLASFTGTTQYHKHLLPAHSPLLITDGCNYIREKCGAYWLFDAIISYQNHSKVKALGFQIWRLKQKRSNFTWVLECFEDIHKPPAVVQVIEFSDFPLEEIKIWVVGGVALLPSEY